MAKSRNMGGSKVERVRSSAASSETRLSRFSPKTKASSGAWEAILAENPYAPAAGGSRNRPRSERPLGAEGGQPRRRFEEKSVGTERATGRRGGGSSQEPELESSYGNKSLVRGAPRRESRNKVFPSAGRIDSSGIGASMHLNESWKNSPVGALADNRFSLKPSRGEGICENEESKEARVPKSSVPSRRRIVGRKKSGEFDDEVGGKYRADESKGEPIFKTPYGNEKFSRDDLFQKRTLKNFNFEDHRDVWRAERSGSFRRSRRKAGNGGNELGRERKRLDRAPSRKGKGRRRRADNRKGRTDGASRANAKKRSRSKRQKPQDRKRVFLDYSDKSGGKDERYESLEDLANESGDQLLLRNAGSPKDNIDKRIEEKFLRISNALKEDAMEPRAIGEEAGGSSSVDGRTDDKVGATSAAPRSEEGSSRPNDLEDFRFRGSNTNWPSTRKSEVSASTAENLGTVGRASVSTVERVEPGGTGVPVIIIDTFGILARSGSNATTHRNPIGTDSFVDSGESASSMIKVTTEEPISALTRAVIVVDYFRIHAAPPMGGPGYVSNVSEPTAIGNLVHDEKGKGSIPLETRSFVLDDNVVGPIATVAFQSVEKPADIERTVSNDEVTSTKTTVHKPAAAATENRSRKAVRVNSGYLGESTLPSRTSEARPMRGKTDKFGGPEDRYLEFVPVAPIWARKNFGERTEEEGARGGTTLPPTTTRITDEAFRPSMKTPRRASKEKSWVLHDEVLLDDTVFPEETEASSGTPRATFSLAIPSLDDTLHEGPGRESAPKTNGSSFEENAAPALSGGVLQRSPKEESDLRPHRERSRGGGTTEPALDFTLKFVLREKKFEVLNRLRVGTDLRLVLERDASTKARIQGKENSTRGHSYELKSGAEEGGKARDRRKRRKMSRKGVARRSGREAPAVGAGSGGTTRRTIGGSHPWVASTEVRESIGATGREGEGIGREKVAGRPGDFSGAIPSVADSAKGEFDSVGERPPATPAIDKFRHFRAATSKTSGEPTDGKSCASRPVEEPTREILSTAEKNRNKGKAPWKRRGAISEARMERESGRSRRDLEKARRFPHRSRRGRLLLNWRPTDEVRVARSSPSKRTTDEESGDDKALAKKSSIRRRRKPRGAKNRKKKKRKAKKDGTAEHRGARNESPPKNADNHIEQTVKSIGRYGNNRDSRLEVDRAKGRSSSKEMTGEAKKFAGRTRNAMAEKPKGRAGAAAERAPLRRRQADDPVGSREIFENYETTGVILEDFGTNPYDSGVRERDPGVAYGDRYPPEPSKDATSFDLAGEIRPTAGKIGDKGGGDFEISLTGRIHYRDQDGSNGGTMYIDPAVLPESKDSMALGRDYVHPFESILSGSRARAPILQAFGGDNLGGSLSGSSDGLDTPRKPIDADDPSRSAPYSGDRSPERKYVPGYSPISRGFLDSMRESGRAGRAGERDRLEKQGEFFKFGGSFDEMNGESKESPTFLVATKKGEGAIGNLAKHTGTLEARNADEEFENIEDLDEDGDESFGVEARDGSWLILDRNDVPVKVDPLNAIEEEKSARVKRAVAAVDSRRNLDKIGRAGEATVPSRSPLAVDRRNCRRRPPPWENSRKKIGAASCVHFVGIVERGVGERARHDSGWSADREEELRGTSSAETRGLRGAARKRENECSPSKDAARGCVPNEFQLRSELTRGERGAGGSSRRAETMPGVGGTRLSGGREGEVKLRKSFAKRSFLEDWIGKGGVGRRSAARSGKNVRQPRDKPLEEEAIEGGVSAFLDRRDSNLYPSLGTPEGELSRTTDAILSRRSKGDERPEIPRDRSFGETVEERNTSAFVDRDDSNFCSSLGTPEEELSRSRDPVISKMGTLRDGRRGGRVAEEPRKEGRKDRSRLQPRESDSPNKFGASEDRNYGETETTGNDEYYEHLARFAKEGDGDGESRAERRRGRK
ncbi:hypothetical protein KM043_000642 [Ampulex compressa]|nr:hypothetical protein KM043_000642 [Ampulex compressa]